MPKINRGNGQLHPLTESNKEMCMEIVTLVCSSSKTNRDSPWRVQIYYTLTSDYHGCNLVAPSKGHLTCLLFLYGFLQISL